MHAHFIITGEVLMDRARDFMLSDDPGAAWRLLSDCLIGERVDPVLRRVLLGEANLTGDSRAGIGVEDADFGDSDTREYVEALRYIYAGRVRLGGRWYRPRAVVLSFCRADVPPGPAPVYTGGPCDPRIEWSKERAKFYALPGERVEHVGKVGDFDVDGRFVIFEPCGEPPHWVVPAKDAQAAVIGALAAGRTLESEGAWERGLRPRFEADRMCAELPDDDAAELRAAAEAAEDAMRQAELERIAAKVREQAGDDVFPMTLGDGRVVQVPRAPFIRWSLGRLPDVDFASLPPWEPVSESGVKMTNDDPCHTDWVLGAGLTIEEGYSDLVNGPAWSAAAELQFAEVDRD